MNRANSTVGAGSRIRFRTAVGHPSADLDVAAFPDLADVVQQRTQERAVAIRDLRDRGHFHGVGRIRRRERERHPSERAQQMHVDGVPVVGVSLRAATDVTPLRDQPDQQAQAIEVLETGDRVRTAPNDPQERVAHVVGPSHVVAEIGGLDRLDLRAR